MLVIKLVWQWYLRVLATLNTSIVLNLIIDIGNTRTKLAVFDDSKIIKKWIWYDWGVKELKLILKKWGIKTVSLSTVRDINEKVEHFLKNNYFYIRLSEKTPLPITNQYKTPKTLGRDRVAAIVGAYQLYPNKNCLVIDAGTCIKMDVLSSEGAFLGGNISPGINMRLQAMHHFTAKLPLVKRRKQNEILGYTTQTAIRNGGQLGALLEVEGFIKRCKESFGKINVILTGGDADFFANNLKTKIFVNHNLVLIGLNKILEYNVQLLE